MIEIFKPRTWIFWSIHGVAIWAFYQTFCFRNLLLAIVMYFFRMFFITAGYHRYFSHRSYSTSRVFQFFIAFCAMTSSQKGVLWWASHHRYHHRHSDLETDIHSPRYGFLTSHMGWFLSEKHESTDFALIKDFAKFSELRWLDRFWMVPVFVYVGVISIVFGLQGILWGFFVSTVMLWHGTFTINSLSHLWGVQSYTTGDTSRNNLILASITLGEGWHNNHHRYPWLARNGLRWYEIDVTFIILSVLSKIGLVRDLKTIQ